jgi:hypothetical protein
LRLRVQDSIHISKLQSYVVLLPPFHACQVPKRQKQLGRLLIVQSDCPNACPFLSACLPAARSVQSRKRPSVSMLFMFSTGTHLIVTLCCYTFHSGLMLVSLCLPACMPACCLTAAGSLRAGRG